MLLVDGALLTGCRDGRPCGSPGLVGGARKSPHVVAVVGKGHARGGGSHRGCMIGSVVWISRCADQQGVAQAVVVVVERQFAVAITCVELHSKHQHGKQSTSI